MKTVSVVTKTYLVNSLNGDNRDGNKSPKTRFYKVYATYNSRTEQASEIIK